MTSTNSMHVNNIIYNGNLLIKVSAPLDNIPSPGDIAMDDSGNRVGIVVEIIGPVKSPFIVVKPDDKSIAKPGIIGTEIRITKKKKRGDMNGRRVGRGGRKKGRRDRKVSRVRKYSHNKRL